MIAHEILEGSLRSCDECGRYVPFDNPDAEFRICENCAREMSSEDVAT